MECFLFVYGSQIAMALIEGMCTSIMQTYFVPVKVINVNQFSLEITKYTKLALWTFLVLDCT